MKHLKKIKPLMDAIEELWARYPELRLAQLLSNAARTNGWTNTDLYYLKDDVLLEALTVYPTKMAAARKAVYRDNS